MFFDLDIIRDGNLGQIRRTGPQIHIKEQRAGWDIESVGLHKPVPHKACME